MEYGKTAISHVQGLLCMTGAVQLKKMASLQQMESRQRDVYIFWNKSYDKPNRMRALQGVQGTQWPLVDVQDQHRFWGGV
jgi:hypothetical protein